MTIFCAPLRPLPPASPRAEGLPGVVRLQRRIATELIVSEHQRHGVTGAAHRPRNLQVVGVVRSDGRSRALADGGRGIPERFAQRLVVLPQGDADAVESRAAGVGGAGLRNAEHDQRDHVVGVIVLDVAQGPLDAELAGVQRRLVAAPRPPAELRAVVSVAAVPEVVVAEEVDHRQRAEPEAQQAAAAGCRGSACTASRWSARGCPGG